MLCIFFSVFEQEPQQDARVDGVARELRVKENSLVLVRHSVYHGIYHWAYSGASIGCPSFLNTFTRRIA